MGLRPQAGSADGRAPLRAKPLSIRSRSCVIPRKCCCRCPGGGEAPREPDCGHTASASGPLTPAEGVIIAVLTQAGLSAETIRRRIERFMPAQPKAAAPAQRRTAGGHAPSRARDRRSRCWSRSRRISLRWRERSPGPGDGRQEEIERVIQILARRTKNNPASSVSPGVGKDRNRRGAGQRIISGGVPGPIWGNCLVQLDRVIGRRHDVPRSVRGAPQEGPR